MGVEVHLQLSDADAEKLMQAIKEGKLKHLGVTNAALEQDDGQVRWANPDLKTGASVKEKPGRDPLNR